MILGGALLITPGFLTDILGLLLLLPPTRLVILRLVMRRVAKKARARVVTGGGRPQPRDADVEGNATEYPHREPPRRER